MAKNGYKAMDSDMHVFEPADLWQTYIDKNYLERAPKGLNRAFRDLGIELEGKVMPIPRKPENPALAKYRQDFFEEKYGEAGKRNFRWSLATPSDGQGRAGCGRFVSDTRPDGLGHGRTRSRLRHRHRARLQRLAARFRRDRSESHVWCNYGCAPRHQRLHRRNPPYGQRIRLSRYLYPPESRQQQKMERSLLRSTLGGMRKAQFAGGLSRGRTRLSAAAGVLSHLFDLFDVQHLRLSLR